MDYAVTMAVVKKKFSADLSSVESSRVPQVPMTSGLQELVDLEPTVLIEKCVKKFADKIDHTTSDLDSGSVLDVQRLLACLAVLWDSVQLVQPEDIDRILGGVRPTTCLLNSCPFWQGLSQWSILILNMSVAPGEVPS